MKSTESQRISNQQLHGLDHLRTLAIVFVFFFHYQISYFGHPEWLPSVVSFGWTGVDLFFVLSGFLISSQLFYQIKSGRSINWRTYLLKRFFRITPAFLIVTFIYFFFPGFREKEALPPLWKFLTFTQNIELDLRDFGTFSHAWSLCVEAHFYYLLPIVFSVLLSTDTFRKSYWLLIVLFAGGWLMRSYSWTAFYAPFSDADHAYVLWYKYVYYPTYNRLDGLLAGITVAGIYHFLPRIWQIIISHSNLLIVCGLLVLLGAYFLCEDAQTYYASVAGFPAVSLGYGFVVAGAVSPSSVLFRLKSALTAFIARISYSIYLTHKGIIHVTQLCLAYFSVDITSNFTLLCCIATCIIGATLLYMLIERPLMNWLNERSKTKQLTLEKNL